MIFLDRSIPRSVADSLKAIRDDVCWLEDHFPHDVKDEDWIPEVAARGWVAVVRDKKIRTRRWQRELVRDRGLGCFIVNQKHDPTRWEYYQLFARCLDEMTRLAETEPRPFMYLIDSGHNFRRFPL